jgi:hypothetical protein
LTHTSPEVTHTELAKGTKDIQRAVGGDLCSRWER